MKKNYLALIVSLSLALAGPVWGQKAPAAAEQPSPEVVELSPFRVSSSDGSWTATTTLIGNRTQQELAKVPAAVDVLTAEFMRDLGLGSLEDSAGFVAGLTVQPRFESRNDDSRVSYRGLSGSSTISRNLDRKSVV